jgi:hypothetical protein
VTYTRLERLLHRIAFGMPGLQASASDIEDAMYRGRLAGVEPGPPIFVTSLARAGTTVLLEALHRLPGIATHLYRDMPFIMAPLLWSRLSAPFRKEAVLKERAHRDGIRIGFDSPEAFEEVLWLELYPHKYGRERIALWTAADATEEARALLLSHMRKIVALRRPEGGRYLSKNNANIARLDLLAAMFPDAAVVVPVRHPIDHAASLLRQHRNFLERHGADAFGRRYMADLGHFEFGELHRPIDFPGLDALIEGLDPSGLDYWLATWIAAFEAVLARADRLTILSHEAACREPLAAMRLLCEALGIPAAEASRAAAVFGPPGAPVLGEAVADTSLADRAETLHEALVSRSLLGAVTPRPPG